MNLVVDDRAEAVSAVMALDEKSLWDDLQSKDIPPAILVYVSRALVTDGMASVRKTLGMESASDKRWKKIMTAIKNGIRVDGTGIFLTWLARNEKMAQSLNERLQEMLDFKQPFSKMTCEAINTMAKLQETTIKMGKDLGIFMDAKDQAATQGSGQAPVTIVVQTHAALPTREEIEIHQKTKREKNDALIAQFRPSDVPQK